MTKTAKTKPTKSWNPMAIVNLLKFRIDRGSMDNRRPTTSGKVDFCVKTQIYMTKQQPQQKHGQQQ